MNSLGIYFGPQSIRIVETKGKEPINNIRIPREAIVSHEASAEKVPEEIKLVSLIKEQLRNNKIETNEATLSLSGKDVIIRIFEMPNIPYKELIPAANFEIKKYIPFKVEELISDFQVKSNKANRKNYVLFMGIKKEILDKYRSSFKEIGLKLKSIEYSGFSVLRLLALANIKEKDVIAFVNIDLKEEDEINFTVLEAGFPLFSRDIPPLVETQKSLAGAPGVKADAALERLKSAIRISLSYYDRTFPTKNISKMILLMDKDHRQDIESFIKEIGLGVQYIDINKCINKTLPFSLDFIKGYCTSLSSIPTGITINLLAVREKALKVMSQTGPTLFSIAKKYRSNLITIGICLFAVVSAIIYGTYRTLPLEKEIKGIIDMRPPVSTLSNQASYEELVSQDVKHKARIKTVDDLLGKQIYLTEALDVIPRVLPRDIQLIDLSFEMTGDERAEFIIRGTAYKGESNKELELVNSLLKDLKENKVFAKYFMNISVVSIDRSELKERTVTNFTISCKNYKEEKWDK